MLVEAVVAVQPRGVAVMKRLPKPPFRFGQIANSRSYSTPSLPLPRSPAKELRDAIIPPPLGGRVHERLDGQPGQSHRVARRQRFADAVAERKRSLGDDDEVDVARTDC